MRSFLTTFASCFARDTTNCCSISPTNWYLKRDLKSKPNIHWSVRLAQASP